MAVIGKIRKHSGLLVVVIALAIVGFLFMDSTQNNAGVFGGQDETVIGTVDGEELTYTEYNQRYEVNSEQYKALQTRSAQSYQLNEFDLEQLGRQTWQELLTDKMMAERFEDLGIGVTDKELETVLLSPTPNPRVQQVIMANYFYENGQSTMFQPSMVGDFVRNLDIPGIPGEDPNFQRKRKLFNYLKKFLSIDLATAKYHNLVAKAFYPSSWMAEMIYEEENRAFSFDYVYIPYAEINPTEVEVTDDDIKKFVSDDKARYETDPYRKVRYFVFDIVPSAADSAAARENVMRFYEGLSNPPKSDSMYVNQNSEVPFNFGYFTLEEYEHPIISKFFDTDSTSAELGLGDIAGPYFENGAYKISKLIDTATIPDSVRVSQIVIKFDDVQTQEAFNARFQLADSLFNAIDTMGAPFEQIAFQYSTDEATKNLGGDMGYITKGELNDIYLDNNIFVKGEQDKVFMGFLNAGPNSIYYIMKVTDYPTPTTQAIRLATIQKSLFTSDETDKNTYAKADYFAYQHNTAEDFMGAFETDTLSIPNVRKLTAERVLEDDYNFGEFRNARNIIASIYNNQEGYVSDVIRRDNKLVVLYIEKAFEGGVMDVEDARMRLEAEVLKEKQGDVIVERLGSYSSAADVASKMSKPVGSINEATFALQNLNGLNEPIVIATATGLDQGQTSKPIRGNEGVFVVQIKSVTPPAKTDDLLPYINQLKGRYTRAFQRSPGSNGRIIDAILEDAEVEDKRLENQL